MLELLAYVMLGVGLGTFTGLIPGIHVNNLAPWLVALAAGFSIPPLNAVAVIVAMMITHTFLSYIPSTFLGAPEEGTALSVLPAHRLLLVGRGNQAIRLTTFGCLGGLVLSSALVLPLALAIGPVYGAIKPFMHWILVAIVVLMIGLEGSKGGILWSALIFAMSGFLGLLALDTNLSVGDLTLVPLLGGLFGTSVLLESLNRRSGIPPQNLGEGADAKRGLLPLVSGTGAGIVTGIVPGIGPAQGTVLAQLATRSRSTEDFLVSVSGVNTAKALYSFVALYAIGRPRSGAAVAVGRLIDVGAGELIFFIGVALFAGGIAAVLSLELGKIAALKFSGMPYRKLCVTVIAGMIGLTVYFCGWMGLPLLFTATAIGLLPSGFGVRRVHCMGVIILPCILHFSGLRGAVLSALGA